MLLIAIRPQSALIITRVILVVMSLACCYGFVNTSCRNLLSSDLPRIGRVGRRMVPASLRTHTLNSAMWFWATYLIFQPSVFVGHLALSGVILFGMGGLATLSSWADISAYDGRE